MKPFVLTVAIVFVLCAAAPAQTGQPAQGQTRPADQTWRPRRITGIGVLLLPEVQKELKLAAGQIEMLEKATGVSRDGGEGPVMHPASVQNQSPASMEKAILPILTSSQRAHFAQLKCQAMGPPALGQEDVAKKLALTAPQRKSVARILDNLYAPLPGRAPGQSRKPMEKVRAEIQAKREAAEKALITLLTPGQRATWTKMQGKAFVFTRMQIRPMDTPR